MNKDITGHKFFRLTAIKEVKKENGKLHWLFKCDCGNEIIRIRQYVTCGDTKSCGCWRSEFKKLEPNYHGEKNTRLYRVWCHMKERCTNSNCKEYKWYGARGITFTEEWKEYLNFKSWALSSGFDNKLTLDRKDNNGNYEPSNCRWVTMKEQANNTRFNRIIEYNGEYKTLAQWADIVNLPHSTLSMRINKLKWPIEKAINTPQKALDVFEYDGKSMTLGQWAKHFNLNRKTLLNRINRGYSPERIFTSETFIGNNQYSKI